jgi:hypothetical protein
MAFSCFLDKMRCLWRGMIIMVQAAAIVTYKS